MKGVRYATARIEAAVESKDPRGYYDGIFGYAALAMKAARNPLLRRFLMDLEPSTRRTQYATLSRRADDLEENVKYFQRTSQYVEKGDGESAGRMIHDYAQNEKRFAIRIIQEEAGK